MTISEKEIATQLILALQEAHDGIINNHSDSDKLSKSTATSIRKVRSICNCYPNSKAVSIVDLSLMEYAEMSDSDFDSTCLTNSIDESIGELQGIKYQE